MKRILIFSGTTEGRQLADILDASGICADVCVATEYGHEVMTEGKYRNIHTGRLAEDEMKEFMQNGDYTAVVDATHPYAVLVSSNIRQAAEQVRLPYYRLRRTLQSAGEENNVIYAKSQQECVRALEQTTGNILLTTGSKELHCYCENETLKKRLFVRVLPGMESIEICHRNGITGKQIIAMQGPFSEEMNLALFHQYQIAHMVTKESGATGGFSEKISAAKKAGVSVYVIKNPEAENGEQKENLEEILKEIERLTGKEIRRKKMQVSLVGIGMGNTKLITEEVAERIRSADLLFGAKRLLDAVPAQWNLSARRLPYYLAKDILPYLETSVPQAVILFSGDTGFYSGAEKMVQALQERCDMEVSVCPGISSVSYLAARSGNSWQDAKIISLHGTDHMELLMEAVRMNRKVFVITSGVLDVREIGKRLLDCGLKETAVTVGYALSYPDEQIKTLSPEECIQLADEGLFTCLIQNKEIHETGKDADRKFLTHGLPDDAFCRDKVPMTKEEVRETAICKMRLKENSVVYDIGSGTGSIAVEMARLSKNLTVYAIERKPEAASLIEKNCEKFELSNVKVIQGEAPLVLADLPVPTHAFIGGSNGSLMAILTDLYQKNPRMRVVVTAITLETVGAVSSILNEFPVEQEEIIQMSVGRAKKAGRYHLMQAENPVFILSFYFAGGAVQ